MLYLIPEYQSTSIPDGNIEDDALIHSFPLHPLEKLLRKQRLSPPLEFSYFYEGLVGFIKHNDRKVRKLSIQQ